MFTDPTIWSILAVIIALFTFYFTAKSYSKKPKIELTISTKQVRLYDPTIGLIFENNIRILL